MDKIDLTEYGSQELSMWVMNDEALYNMRHRLMRETLEDLFEFTDEQWDEFQEDLEDE